MIQTLIQTRTKIATAQQTGGFHKEAIRILLTGGGLLLLVCVVVISFVVSDDEPTTGSAVQALRSFNNSSIMRQQRHGVFCFGDSLTAGTSGMREYPYATYLQQALDENSQSSVDVQHVGYPGWTVQQIRREKNHPKRGLVTWIQNWNTSTSKLELVILLGGTNDLGLRFAVGADAIADDIIDLHQSCYEAGVPRTLAIAIPSSAYQAKRSPEAAELAAQINQKLAEFCNKEPRATFVEFPFGFNDENMEKWYYDGLHFSEKGYETLGRYLQPFVNRILETLEQDGA